jgi:hypothetical protein
MELIAVDDFESHELGTRSKPEAAARKAAPPPARKKVAKSVPKPAPEPVADSQEPVGAG